MYKVLGLTQYVLDHDVPSWSPSWDNRTKQELKVTIPAGRVVDIVDETSDNYGDAVHFRIIEPEAAVDGIDWCANADDFWGQDEWL